MGGGQHLEWPNVERPIFRDFEILNIQITKIVLFDFSIFELVLYFYDCLNYSNTQNTYRIIYIKFEIFGILIVLQIIKFWNFYNFWNSTISEIWLFYHFFDNGNFMIFEIVWFGKFLQFFFQYEKPKLDSKHWQILILFIHSIFRTIRNFANSHICILKF